MLKARMMTKKKLGREVQCAKCPWKTSTDPNEIPDGYSRALHAALESTIAQPGSLGSFRQLGVMACHESPLGEETYCIGWLFHQLGPGNNIGLRIKMMGYDLSNVQTVGEQHSTFEATLPVEEETC